MASNAANERVYSSYHVVSLHVNRVPNGLDLIWQAGPLNIVLKHSPVANVIHTFCVDAKLNWSTGTAEVTVDGVVFEGLHPASLQSDILERRAFGKTLLRPHRRVVLPGAAAGAGPHALCPAKTLRLS